MKIVSGGQTGVDRAALDFAIRRGFEHGGWCPRGRKAEDGKIPPHYRLRETESPNYAARTERNVIEADATVIFAREAVPGGGTALTHELALRHGRPVLVLRETGGVAAGASRLIAFLKDNTVKTLNVAGPRESEAAGIGGFVEAVLARVFPEGC